MLRQLQATLEAACPPDLTAPAERVQESWSRLLGEEAHTTATVLLNTLEPYQKEIEHHFALERQRKFRNIMGTYLYYFNRLKYAGSTLRDHIRFLPSFGNKVDMPREWDLASFTHACSKAASEQHLGSRNRALANRLLVEADAEGFPVQLLNEPTEAVSKLDWKNRYAQSMTDVLNKVGSEWSKPTGIRRLMQGTIIFFADWLPLLACAGMVTKLLWDYTMDKREFHLGDLLLPAIVMILVVIILHVVISLFLPLRWQAIRGEFERELGKRLSGDLETAYTQIPSEVAHALVGERRQMEQFLIEIREVSGWLEKQEQAASIAGLYGRS
ncbi:MAG: hypothetical protein HY040_12460 [Planctomycetes bacterium]|nr:hypothetical protein [Planctomycetota bacterium]